MKEKSPFPFFILAFCIAVPIILGVFLLIYSNTPRHPTTFSKVPLYPGAVDVQFNLSNHELYKEVTFKTDASFDEVAAFYEKVFTADAWVLEIAEPDKRWFRHTAHREPFFYSADLVSEGRTGSELSIRLKLICHCTEL